MAAVLYSSNAFEQDFAGVESSLPGASLGWLAESRRKAIRQFVQVGFPTTKLESWRHTPIDALVKTTFARPAVNATSVSKESIAKTFPGLSAFQLVFVDGRFSEALSTIPSHAGVKAGNLTEALVSNSQELASVWERFNAWRDQPFVALNESFFESGAYIHMARETRLETPIHLHFVVTESPTPVQVHPRVVIAVDAGASASVVETYWATDGCYWTNAVTEILLGENAVLNHFKVQMESPAAYHFGTTQVYQTRSSRFRSQAILLGGAISRNMINVALDGDGAECQLDGIYLVNGKQLSDSHTYIDHIRPHTVSREYYKGILDGRAQGVFDGHIVVRKEAQKTDSSQTNKNLLLSNEARVNTKPELKIFANDVKCKHGATIGQINAEQLFYLQSRGITKANARQLLVYAFASELVDRIELPALREMISEVLFAKFHAAA